MGDARAKGTIHGIVPISNYEIYTGVSDTYWVDTTHYVVTVPADHIYLFWGGYLDGDAAGTINIYIKDASDNIIMGPMLTEADCRVGYGYPDPALIHVNMPIPLQAGWYVELLYGGAQGAGAFASCVCTPILLT